MINEHHNSFIPDFFTSIKIYHGKIFLFNSKTDCLYEIDTELYHFLKESSHKGFLKEDLPDEIFKFLKEERLIDKKSLAGLQKKEIPEGVFNFEGEPPLKYLHLITTTTCDFNCKHCFLDQENVHAEIENVEKVIDEFARKGGLRLIVSGGEPLLYRYFERLNLFLKDYPQIRKILLTNGYSLSKKSVDYFLRLNFDEIQFSLDGPEDVHDFIRRPGSFKAVLEAISKSKNVKIDVSIATTLSSLLLERFEEFLSLLGIIEPFRWTIDFMCPVDNARQNNLVPPVDFSHLLLYAKDSGLHSPEIGFACGSNLATLLPDGTLAKCDYFPEINGGNVFDSGLVRAWLNLPKIRIEDLCSECQNCIRINDCRAGCRYRALLYNGNIAFPDPIMCQVYLSREGTKP